VRLAGQIEGESRVVDLETRLVGSCGSVRLFCAGGGLLNFSAFSHTLHDQEFAMDRILFP
jgi:hypothetical protein